jgi:hypothetical protein
VSTNDSSAVPSDPFQVWVNPPSPRKPVDTGAVIKTGPRVKKDVHLEHRTSLTTGRTTRTLRFRSYPLASANLPSGELPSWYCTDSEIDKLLGYLGDHVARTGRYRLVDTDSPAAALMDLLRQNEINFKTLADVLVRHGDVGRIVQFLANTSSGLAAAEAAVIQQRRRLVADLRSLVEAPDAREPAIQHLIGKAHWIFGGRYVGVADRRSLIQLDQFDIPLVGPDGTLHIVELKQPSYKDLIVRHRNHWIVGRDIHEAVSQAQCYLRDLDEMGASATVLLRNELGQHYDMSRAFATVVIGHAKRDQPANADEATVGRTLRQYSATLNRVEVITYDQLVDSADRALRFEEELGQLYAVEQHQDLVSPDRKSDDF